MALSASMPTHGTAPLPGTSIPTLLGILGRAFVTAQALDAELRAPVKTASKGNRGGAMTDAETATGLGRAYFS